MASRILADWDDTTAVAGTNVVYAAMHHFATRGIPARPFLGLSADARGVIVNAIVGLRVPTPFVQKYTVRNSA